jgi:site-specific recombinase XerD
MHEAMEQYLHYLGTVRGLSQKSLTAYTQDLNALSQYCSEIEADPLQLSRDQARRFIAYLMKHRYQPSSVNRRLSGVKGFYTYCVRFDLCPVNPFSHIRSLTGSRRLPSVLTREEVEQIMQAAGNDFAGIRDRVMFELLYSTGCRLSELLAVNLGDIHIDESSILVHGKGAKDRYVFLTPSAEEALTLYLPLRRMRQETAKCSSDDRKALLISSRGRRLTPQGVHYLFNSYTEALGIPKHITPHTFRHTFATHILEQDAGIRVVQELLGHENISTTQIYSHVSSGRLKEVYKKSHPHG